MYKKVNDNKLILELLYYFIIIEGLSFCFFHKYFLKFSRLKLKIMSIENILTKVIQAQLMKSVPFGPVYILILAMIKVIVVEFEHN